MFLARSKTSSALNTYEQQPQQQPKHVKNNTAEFPPLIPKEMISVLQDAIPSIESALKPVLPQSANELIVEMLSTWITCSRISAANNDFTSAVPINKAVAAKPAAPIQPMTLRSWVSRSFSMHNNKPKSAVGAIITTAHQQPLIIEISDNNKLCNNIYNDSTPSLSSASSSNSSFSIKEDDVNNSPSLYTPLLLDSAAAPTSATIPVSLKSMIDLLDTPPLIASDDGDCKSLSLIEEALTPLSSTFFHDNDDNDNNSDEQVTAIVESSPMASTFTTAKSITSTAKAEAKSVRRSFSTIFVQLGNSMKKVFATNKKKSRSTDISRLTKSLSVQHNLSTIAENQQHLSSVKQHISPISMVS
jgi:hypothetical protein